MPGCSSSSSNPCWSFYSSIQAGHLHPKYIAGFSSLLQSSSSSSSLLSFFFSGSRSVLHCRLSLSFLDACFSSLHTHLSLKNDNCAAFHLNQFHPINFTCHTQAPLDVIFAPYISQKCSFVIPFWLNIGSII